MKRIGADRALSCEPELVTLPSYSTVKAMLLVVSLLVGIFAACLSASPAQAQTISVAVTPPSVTLNSRAAQQFTATVQGTASTGVKWSVSAGTITSSGLFTAPAVTSTTAVTITATSTADATKTASATVAVVNRPAPAVNAVDPQAETEAPTGGSSQYGQPQQQQFDGPAELPRVYIDSSLAHTPSSGKTWNVAKGGDLQQALNNAACGDTVALQAGATFSASLTIPAKSCDDNHWITVRTSAPDSKLPAEGTRITPCYAGVQSLPGRPAYPCTNPQNVMAKIVYSKKTGCGPFVFAPGANHYRFVGLEITRTTDSPIVYSLISMTPGSTADHLVFDRMWVHGTTHDETAHGVRFGGSTYAAVVDSYFTDFHCTSMKGTCTDASAVGGGIGDNPMGPYKIVDNFLEASGENILFGGAEGTQTPDDIEIRFNHLFKPLTWLKGQHGYVGGKDGYPFIVKNLIELKNAQRVLLEGNVLEYSWGGFTQTGFGLILLPSNQMNKKGQHTCPLCQVTDITLRYSMISHVASGMQIANASKDGVGAYAGERYSIHDIVIDDINPDLYNGYGLVAQVSMGPDGSPVLQNVNIGHITAFAPNVLMTIGSKRAAKMVNFNFLNNMVLAGARPLTSTGGKKYNCADHSKTPSDLLDNCFSPFLFAGNALIANPESIPQSAWPTGNYFPQSPKGQFVNYNGGNGGNYRLAPGSPYKNAGTDGKDVGADIDSVNQYTANSR